MLKIYGAGITGLMAGCIFPNAQIFEANDEGAINHKAVLRFRNSSVGDALGIDFRQVRVHKGLWMEGKFVEPNIQLANLYSKKVIGKLADRSIWNLAPSDRFVAPENFIEQMIERCSNRIEWSHKLNDIELMAHAAHGGMAISTLPMSLMAKFMLGEIVKSNDNTPSFQYAPIVVRRWRIMNSDVFQTIYFPSPNTTLYRASITGDLLIAEYVNEYDESMDFELASAFGLSFMDNEIQNVDTTKQSFGKIARIDDVWRKRFIFELTTKKNIFSAGRFAIWKNVLLDDVLHDLYVIKKLMNTTTYEKSLHISK
ncbi:MAG TPA: hypothetical protein VFM18_23385 [Methanosarcina sp.]|nr:hypothetical protein [Methanosarcina sp.]